MPDHKYKAALKRLRSARLILTKDPAAPLDCHPLIREHFAAVMRETAPDAFRDGHSRLYEHYCKQAPEQLNFFQSPWTAPIPSLSSADQAWVISELAFALRALGRLADAVDPMRAAAGARVKQASWRNAAVNYGNLSELLLTVGNVKEAIDTARMAVELTDRSGDWFQRMGKRAILADVLHQSGSMAASGRQFEEAEGLQTEQQPEYPVLYSVQGYRYCDFFLSRGQAAEVVRRASLTVRWVESRSWLLDIGLDHLSLGRAYPPGSADSAAHLNQAVEYLRRSGDTDVLPLALLARGTDHDLDEVFRIPPPAEFRVGLSGRCEEPVGGW